MKARVQAPRTFWDSSYKENSWIGQWRSEFLPLIPTVQESIDKYNPGTKLAFTEYNFGGGGDISGGISLADTLGIFGKYGVYLATLWPLSDKADELTYHNAAMNLYTNYDGKKSSYGDTNVKLDNSDTVNSSAYASIEGNDDSKAHIIVMNKDLDKAMNANISITSNSTYTKGTVYGFDKNNDTVVKLGTVNNIKNNKFTYKLDEMSVIHIVLEGESSSTSVDKNGIIDGGIYYIKNVNSGQYLDVYNGIDKNNTNIQQHPGNKLSAQQFKVVSTGDGYYKLVSQVGNGKRVVDVSGKKSTNGANIILYDDKESDNQKFKLEDLGDSKYLIRTKISKNKSVVEVKDASKAKKANVQQWEYNKHKCQQWEFELVK
ncbi:PKD domain containing protein [Clostridium bornimense]|uniref:PKD domain containing protein n=1 Tax=Clostridium bornimense TaxID=1216932 RepID=W6S105_9CLOT|nr:RICIN domain-containing protein [Clostridium bornimense]CDM70398.1 PKD domain containing protein [Clostridium bornimense]